MEYFENIHYYPSDSKFNVCLVSQNVKQKIKNKCNKFENINILHVILYLFNNEKYFQYFKFDENIEDIILKILEKTSKKLNLEIDRDKINTITSDISYFTNSKILDFWYQKFPEIFDKNFTYNYVYNLGYENILENEYNLLLAAFDNQNYENVLYLIKNHKFNFWNKVYGKKIQDNKLTFIENILKYCPLTLNTEHINILITFISMSDLSIQILLYNHFLELNIQDIVFTNKILMNCISNNNVKFIGYILDNPKFPGDFLTNQFWSDCLYDIYSYDNNIDKNINHYIKKEFYQIFINYILKNKEKDFNEIICYDDRFLINLVKLPNVTEILDKVINVDILNDNYYNNILFNIIYSNITYGTIETLIYFVNNKPNLFKNLKNETIYNIECVINFATLNKDIRVTRYIFDFYKDYIKHLKLDFNFLNKSGKEYNKIKKLKLVSKYINFKDFTDIQYKNLFKVKFKNINVKKWLFKKLFDDKISSEYFSLIPSIYEFVEEESNLNFYDYFLKRIDISYNFWLLLTEVLKDYTWHCLQSQKVLQYCKKYSGELKYKSFNIKKTLLDRIISYNNCNWVSNSIEQFENSINIIKNSNFDFELYDTQKHYICLINVCDTLFKATLRCGFKFSDILVKICKNFNYYIDLYQMKKWLVLYKLIRRLRIRRDFRNKRKHKYSFQESIINLETKPMRVENSLVHRGGPQFYFNMDEIDSMYESEGISYVYPKHILPHQMIKINYSNITISQKTDGILKMDIDKDTLYPAVSEDFEYVKMDAEYIEKLDLYLVFGLRSYTKIHNSPLDDYNDLISEHKYCSNSNNYFDTTNRIDIIRNIMNETKNILKFCNENKDKKNKWYPKKVWYFRDKKLILLVLNIIEQYQVNLANKCQKIYDNQEMSSFIKMNEFKTDGIIIYKNKKEIYKYKPKDHMTSDLSIDGQIWRCYWNDNKWNKREIRCDKQYPNPAKLVEELEYYHQNSWCIQDIIDYLKESVIKDIYYQHDNVTDYDYNSFRKYNQKIFNDIVETYYYRKRYNFLDLGCGYCNNILWKDNDTKIDGIDIDIAAIENNKNKNLYIGDLTQKWNNKSNSVIKNFYSKHFNLQNLIGNYDIVIMNFSIQYVFQTKEGFKNFISELNRNTKINTQLYMSFITIEEDIYLPKGSYIKMTESQIEYDEEIIKKVVPRWMRTYYTFRHYTPINEPMINSEKMKELMKLYGWKFSKDFEKENKIKNSWSQLNDNIKRYGFIRIK